MNPLKLWLNKSTKPTTKENEYKPKFVCVATTAYPNGKAQFSPNGSGEWYGITETKKK